MRNDIIVWGENRIFLKSEDLHFIFDTEQIHWDQNDFTDDNVKLFLETTPNKKRIVVVSYTYGNHEPVNLHWANLVVCISQEYLRGNMYEYRKNAQKIFNNENIVFISNEMRTVVEEPYNFICRVQNYFFSEVVRKNKFQDTNTFPKPKLLDALLGSKKPQREFMMSKFLDSSLLSKSLISYTTGNINVNSDIKLPFEVSVPNYRSGDLDYFEESEILDRFDMNTYFNSLEFSEKRNTIFSCMVPYKIYQASYFSVVAETLMAPYPFVTEKTGKPLYAKRLFILLGPANTLKNLKRYGYVTFDDVVDEAYDQIEDNLLRQEKVWRCIEQLSTENLELIYEKINDKLEHNHHIIGNVYASMLNEIKEFVSRHVD